MTDNNIPSYDVDEVTLGQCIVYMDLYTAPTSAGVTPSTDVGAVDEVSFTASRELLDLWQGTPQTLIQQWAVKETGVLTLKGWQWDYQQMYNILADGTTAYTSPTESLDFGGGYTVQPVQIRLMHQCPTGATIYLDFWRASGAGELTFNFNPSDFNKFDYNFNIWKGVSNWTAGSLTRGIRMFKYTRVKPP